jgi:hypothetical protein
LSLFTTAIASGQNTYTQFDITIAVTGNPNREVDPYIISNLFFIPDGIGSKFGYGVHYKNGLD